MRKYGGSTHVGQFEQLSTYYASIDVYRETIVALIVNIVMSFFRPENIRT